MFGRDEGKEKSSVTNVCLWCGHVHVCVHVCVIGWSGKSKGNIAQAKKTLDECVCFAYMLMCVGCVCCVSLQCTCVVCESQGFKLSCECIVPSLIHYLLILYSTSRLLFLNKNAHICFT